MKKPRPRGEFGAVGGFMADHPYMVMLVDASGVTVTCYSSERADYWADYVRDDHERMWVDVHVPSGYPVSSLFSGAYTPLEAHPLDDTTRPRYLEMLDDLASRGQTYTEYVPRSEWSNAGALRYSE